LPAPMGPTRKMLVWSGIARPFYVCRPGSACGGWSLP